jgi:hypothetical protein
MKRSTPQLRRKLAVNGEVVRALMPVELTEVHGGNAGSNARCGTAEDVQAVAVIVAPVG